jgi:hypothetical protein
VESFSVSLTQNLEPSSTLPIERRLAVIDYNGRRR